MVQQVTPSFPFTQIQWKNLTKEFHEGEQGDLSVTRGMLSEQGDIFVPAFLCN
jgi:hypothetical protein